VSQAFWQAKIWGLLHDPPLKALRSSKEMGEEGAWDLLECMQGWVSPKQPEKHKQSELNATWLKYVGLCDLIAAASDRSTVGRLPAQYSAVSYSSEGLEIRHLLSGKEQTIQIEQWHKSLTTPGRTEFTREQERQVIPESIRTCKDARKVFWWFWRCYPQALAKDLPELHLLPAETRLPDASLWSHVTMTSAMAGALAGYYSDPSDYPKKGASFKRSRPHIATFTFTPVQELIKASRKMRDFWAGSWLLHYLSAKVCWDIAWKYGPDTFLYPCLYAQPLIDYWLLNQYSDFGEWIKRPDEQQLLTAGFPNVLVLILPDNGLELQASTSNPVRAAMSHAASSLEQEWKRLSKEVLEWLQRRDNAWKDISLNLWNSSLKAQWQHYWVALPIGDRNTSLTQSPRETEGYQSWTKKQNDFARPPIELLLPDEQRLIEVIFNIPSTTEASEVPDEPDKVTASSSVRGKYPNLNVGSWWAGLFDQTRRSLSAVKNARSWQIPAAFGPRSTVSGVGSVVHPIYDPAKPDWATEGQTSDFWSHQVGLFDGIEELNASEVLKRGLHKILSASVFPEIAGQWRTALYSPDLSSGVAGWLHKLKKAEEWEAIQYFCNACEQIGQKFPWTVQDSESPGNLNWGIPWITAHHPGWLNPRLLNAGWLIDDFDSSDPEAKQRELQNLRDYIATLFRPGNNPTDWYVLAAGDGDGMSNWLRGTELNSYRDYIPLALQRQLSKMPEEIRQPFEAFLAVKKRMGPSTHSALSRALLDFSNQLVPYLTEERYAGRLIYGGGDDVLAYTNLWEWDSWLWDIRQCFRGDKDPQGEFNNPGHYWQCKDSSTCGSIANRPLFTMGDTATISFGIVIAHHSVPLAIALENLWEAETEAKEHICYAPELYKKDAVQVRVLYGNGNILKATSKFEVFNRWQSLLQFQAEYPATELDAALFEQAAQLWRQHPAPVEQAIRTWGTAFCDRRELFKADDITKTQFCERLTTFLKELWVNTQEIDRDYEIQKWLKLAAFVLRNRDIKLRGEN
jgi:CRISPR-associated protein Cmr2